LLEDLKPGESISAEQVQASGVSFADLPPETPIELRTSESGEVLIITAEVAANVELVTDVGALAEAIFTDPGAALAAFGSIGADMTEGEREEATDMVVATVVATGAAINAAAVAAGGATGGSGSGGSSGGGSGANSPGSRGGRKW
jgi:ethanolamine utilization protein EutA (predicted chaperonin)